MDIGVTVTEDENQCDIQQGPYISCNAALKAETTKLYF